MNATLAAVLLALAMVSFWLSGAGRAQKAPPVSQENAVTASSHPRVVPDAHDRVVLSDAEWKQILTAEQYRILRQKGTERAFSGAYWNTHDRGTYVCAACALPLFSSQAKFDSGTGWPSYWQPIAPNAVTTERDWSWGMARTEVLCRRCGGHLGHVFEDGPKPTGLRYCMNAGALRFVPDAAR